MWSAFTSAEIMTEINPATGEPIYEVPMSTREEVHAAVSAATSPALGIEPAVFPARCPVVGLDFHQHVAVPAL